MHPNEFRAFLDMLMVTDPWHDPCFEVLEEFANRESRLQGYEDWIDAYHKYKVE